MKALAGVVGVVDQQLTWSESLAVNVLKLAHLLHDLVGAVQVDEAEWTCQSSNQHTHT